MNIPFLINFINFHKFLRRTVWCEFFKRGEAKHQPGIEKPGIRVRVAIQGMT